MAHKAYKGKRQDKRPARARYWNSRTLLRNKVRNLVRCTRVPEGLAEEVWLHMRSARRTAGPIRNMVIAPLSEKSPVRNWVAAR